MCGICGFIATKNNKVTPAILDNVKRLLILNEERGTDSTGLALIGGKSRVVRATCEASHFTKQVKFTADHSVLLGHTRWATVGAITNENSHPFTFGKITGVHNGSVVNYREIDGSLEVDSMAIFKQLDKEHNNFGSVFPKLSGNFAIAWVSADEPDTLFLVRDGNPCYVAKTKEGLYFSSIETSLKAVLMGEVKDLYQIPENRVFKITKNKITQTAVSFKHYGGLSSYNKGSYDYSSYDEEYDYDVPVKVSDDLKDTDETDVYEGYFLDYLYEEGWRVLGLTNPKAECEFCSTKLELMYDEQNDEVCCRDCLKQVYNYD